MSIGRSVLHGIGWGLLIGGVLIASGALFVATIVVTL